ncbi:MAG: fused MFS/spermidine synthase [Bdellovibrionales bacterium]
MNKTLPIFALFAVIILEGYVVLSSELLAIRQTIPFVGSGTDTVSIIIAAVLMPLAFGYQAGGRFKPGFKENGKYQSIRSKLIQNLFISMCILLIGLSYALINVFFMGAIEIGLTNRLLLTTSYSLIFLVIPVYLLGQTIPLISNYFGREKLAKVTGKILFFSTFGSFLGAVFSTLVLMSFIGVHHTVSLNFIILAGLIILLSRKKLSEKNIIVIGIAACALFLNSEKVMDAFGIVENNKYNTITYIETDENGEIGRNLVLNNNSSSLLTESGKKHDYVEFIEDIAINPIANNQNDIKEILVIGAGAFTLGVDDDTNLYDYLDIDASLLKISETLILKEELGTNKTFHPTPARAFLTQTEKKYDLIILDAYLGALTLPEHLVTQEFYGHVKSKLKDNGVIVGNFILSANFEDKFSRNLHATLKKVYPNLSRHAINHEYNIWPKTDNISSNVIYIYNHNTNHKTPVPYTDNKNKVFYDRIEQRQNNEE